MAKDAEAVIDAVVSTLTAYSTGLWTTVAANRDLENEPWESDELPAINITQGPEDDTILGSTLQDNNLTVFIEGFAVDDGVTDPEDVVNRMARQAQTALYDPWYTGGNLLGLSYVWNLAIIDKSQLIKSSSSGIAKATKSTTYSIMYRTEHQALGG